jgi:RNA polymerase primary sigma factor
VAASTSSSAVPADSVHKVVAATTTASKRVTASTRSQKSATATKPSRTGKSASKAAKNTAPVQPDVATAADGVAADGVAPDGVAAQGAAEADPDVATLEADENVDVLLEESAAIAAAVEVEPDDEEAAEGAEDTADFAWEDEEESEALRQARKDAEMTASADSVRAYLKQIGKNDSLLTRC